MPLVIPYQRVLVSDGKLLGYGAVQGLPTKDWLLELEVGQD
jgi:O6-methylguanine-DNA--protein-cysteine methyltransferase